MSLFFFATQGLGFATPTALRWCVKVRRFKLGELFLSLCQSDASSVLITSEEQREPPPLPNDAGPHSFSRGSATLALTHYLSEETGPVGDIQGPLPPAGADPFFEGLIGKEAERVTTKER